MNQLESDAPVFSEPWQAQVFAMAVRLSESGVFTWREWTQALGARLQSGDDYFTCWLDTLTALIAARGLIAPEDLAACKRQWAEAYLHTPHGQPVELG